MKGSVSGYTHAEALGEITYEIDRAYVATDLLERLGLEADIDVLVDDESLLSLKEVAEELPPVFTRDTLRDEWEHYDSMRPYAAARVIENLDTLVQRTGMEISEPPYYDVDMLEEHGLGYEEDGFFYPTEKLHQALESGDDLYHFSPRLDWLEHPAEV